MKKYKFKVSFNDDFLIVYAFNETEAKIKAQSKRINQAKDYYVTQIEQWVDHDNRWELAGGEFEQY